MRLSIFSDELGIDITEGISTLRDWGLDWVDFRGRMFGKRLNELDAEEMSRLNKLVKNHGMKTACLESSLAKVHLPDNERLDAEAQQLEAIIRAADALDCRLVRAFFFWRANQAADAPLHPDHPELQKVLDSVGPLCERAKEAGLVLAFENCGVSVAECFTVLDAVGIPEFGLAWDCANEWVEGPGDSMGEPGILERVRRTLLVHAKAVGAVTGPAEVQVPWEDILLALATHGFTGPVTIETHNPDDSVSNTEMSHRLLQRLRRAWPGV